MAGIVRFNRNFAAFGDQVRSFEKSSEIGWIITHFIIQYYPINEFIEDAKISTVWLGEGETPSADEKELDIILRTDDRAAGAGAACFNIILRQKGKCAGYGGYCYGEKMEVTDEIVSAYRVLILHRANGEKARYQFNRASGEYEIVGPAAGKTASRGKA